MKNWREKIGEFCRIKKGKKFVLMISPVEGKWLNPHKERGIFVGMYTGKNKRKCMVAWRDVVLLVYKKDLVWLKMR